MIKWIRSCADAQDETTGRKYVRNVPALIIDDEADLASVDTRQQEFDEDGKPDEEHDPTKTNRNIRLLLRSFEKVAYVGYTATPFANIYIHEKSSIRELGDDLFPRSFIVNIPRRAITWAQPVSSACTKTRMRALTKYRHYPIVRPVKDFAKCNENGEIDFDEV